jgi:hypothetical protein
MKVRSIHTNHINTAGQLVQVYLYRVVKCVRSNLMAANDSSVYVHYGECMLWMGTALPHTVPSVCAVTRPLASMVAVPVPAMMLHVTSCGNTRG